MEIDIAATPPARIDLGDLVVRRWRLEDVDSCTESSLRQAKSPVASGCTTVWRPEHWKSGIGVTSPIPVAA
ncbi:hypothetical protein ACSVDM_01620 [Nocardia sp. JW2]|uniref:hypothetical protein n=1 Tax=Nocardia sp. JW2 TaxID=3450738 RepID=UPI003F434238